MVDPPPAPDGNPGQEIGGCCPSTRRELDMDTAFIIGQLFNGFSVASLYILAALGLAVSKIN